MSELEIAMQLTLKAMELHIIGIGNNEQSENIKEITDFYTDMYKTIHAVRRGDAKA